MILGISPLISFILALRLVLVAKLVISGILSSIFLTSALYTYFLTTSFLYITLLKSTGVASNFPMSNLLTLFSKLFKLHGTFFNLSISNLSTSDVKWSKS